MKIDFTREEYRHLLDILYIAHWMLEAHKVGDDPRIVSYSELEQKICSFAQKMGYADLIEYDSQLQRYFPTREYEDNSLAHTFIGEYDNDSFWEELIERLATRDLARQVGGYEKIPQLSREAFFTRLGHLEEQYSKEFTKNGLDNLKVVGMRRKGTAGNGPIRH